MSRLRRLVLTGRIFFITTHFHRDALPISDSEHNAILTALDDTRAKRHFHLFAYVLMPTHVHLLLSPAGQDTFSSILREFKIRAAKSVARPRRTAVPFWQARSFDRIIRTPKEFSKTLEYIHMNPVNDGLVKHPAEWKWSSWIAYNGSGRPPVPVEFAELPTDEHARLW